MPIVLTREELFNQVWKRPMTKVAADYDISDVALNKICKKHRIPVPGRGYWAKKAAGKKVNKAYLRAISDSEINKIVIYGSPMKRLPEMVKKAKIQANKMEFRVENHINVEIITPELHPKVERTKKKLEKAKPSKTDLAEASGQRLFKVQVAPQNVERAIAPPPK